MALEIAFWAATGLIVYAHLGYPLVLAVLSRLFGQGEEVRDEPVPAMGGAAPPRVALIVAAYDEADVIERKVADALALDYPRERLQVVVASDGSSDRTVELARAAGARISVDLSSVNVIREFGAAQLADRFVRIRPDVVFGNEAEHAELRVPSPSRIVKRGAVGATIDGRDYPAVAGDVVDTTGAGDALAAGYLVGGPQLAMEAAARCVANLGTMP
jgi:cellulose synthase/poly-beta-1,6-N-acetylglucosamine synthase-like glycosyltransferase